MATEYEINYEDERFKEVETQKDAALSENEKLYSGMIEQSDKFYQDQINASKEWADTQSKLQQEQTDFAIDKIEQQKDQANKDYLKEQSGAYVDWQKESNKYGANAEQIASQGMAKTGYSESSQVNLYNTYQNRVAQARESYNKIILDFDNGIREARLQNNSALAEIRFKALEQQLAYTLEGFQYKNQLLMQKLDQKTSIENNYYARWQDVLKQINTENSLAEQIRQFNASLEEEKRQFNAQRSGYSSGYSGGSSYKKSSSSSSSKTSKTGSATVDKPKGNGALSGVSSAAGNLASATKKSILALGQGPISAKNLASQVASGKVKEKTNNNGITIFGYNIPLKR